MATSYPAGVDALTNPVGTDPMSLPAHATQHANANDAIEAIETTLGTNPQGSASTVSARVLAVENFIPAMTASVDAAALSASQSATSAAAANAYEISASTIYINFDKRYLGSASVAPTLDNQGASLVTGALYFNTVDADMKVRNSSASWQSVSASAVSAYLATEALYDTFDDRYLGAKASDPTVDNDGNPLVAGQLYFNTTTDVMKVYTGTAWINASDTPYNWNGPIAISASSASPALQITQLGAGDVIALLDEATDTTPFRITANGSLLSYATMTASGATGRFQGHGAVTQCTNATRPGSPLEGDIIYETDTDLFYGWNGSEWTSIGGGSIAYSASAPTSNLSSGTLWVDSDGESALANANDYYTKTETYTQAQVNAIVATAGYTPFFLMGA